LSKQHQSYRAVTLITTLVFLAATERALSQTTEETVVTACEREESSQCIPQSITAFTAEQLQASGADNSDAVATPTVNFNTVAKPARRPDESTIRGQSANAVQAHSISPSPGHQLDAELIYRFRNLTTSHSARMSLAL
jgi:outer membrane receptor protein involved in Fe transport